ncbi:MAG: glutamate--tRNA ligase [Pseudomonadota bacterium]
MVRTRFAPSPTGYLHIGGARTALYSWAYARKHGGRFILRIEDTDLERSTQESVQAILDGMTWLGLAWDEGPYHQMQRLDRYREVAEQLIRAGRAYYCYASKEELEAMREAQRARGEKPRYDGRWRPEKARGKTPPSGVKPVVRFRNPDEGEVAFEDLVKGPIVVSNSELDDLVILRSDGVPTYNFGVVVDDLDMGITHVIRGDDHVANTPRQINILRALGAPLPQYAHVPMILGADGERLSKRHGAVSVLQYRDQGYLPEALLNYLARLGWSHGNDEVFTLEQFVEWFDLRHISRSPARFDPEKLRWLNGEHLRRTTPQALAVRLAREKPDLYARIERVMDPAAMIGAVQASVALLSELEALLLVLAEPPALDAALRDRYLNEQGRAVLRELRERLGTAPWTLEDIRQAIREVLAARGLKTPQVMMPLRVAVTGMEKTPDIVAVVAALKREAALARLDQAIASS